MSTLRTIVFGIFAVFVLNAQTPNEISWQGVFEG